MSFLTPLFLFLGLLAGPIIIMYMLRLRRQEVLVSSTMLWQKLLRDREANAPWQKLRRNLLLILQLLILAFLVLALARPFLPIPTVIRGSVVVLLDGSASMQATDVAPNRFSAAKTQVAEWIKALGGADRMTLILVGQTPQVLASASNDRAALQQALAAAQAAPAGADWPAAFALASGAAQGFQDARILIISDGGLPDGLPRLPAATTYIPIGQSGENLALTALATRNTESGPQLFASVANTGQLDQTALLTLHLGDTLFDSQRISVPAGQMTNLTWQLPTDITTIQASISEQSQDYLALDDKAWAVHEGGVNNRALLVTPGNLFLEQIYGVLPGIQAFKAPPEADLSVEPFDLYVFDSVPLPETLPAGDLFIINPQSGPSSVLEVSGVFSNTAVTRLADSPLLQFVDWGGVHIQKAQMVIASWAQPLISAEGGPLLLTGEQNGYRVAVLTFKLQESDLPLQIAFPILIANLTNWLSPGRAFDAPAGLQVGDPIPLVPGPTTTIVLVKKPDESLWTTQVGEESPIFSETNQLGLYQVILRDETGDRPAGSFAVNLFTPAESAINPLESLDVGQTTPAGAEKSDLGQQELWPWLAGLAFVVLAVEWWIHHRGLRLPKLTITKDKS